MLWWRTSDLRFSTALHSVFIHLKTVLLKVFSPFETTMHSSFPKLYSYYICSP